MNYVIYDMKRAVNDNVKNEFFWPSRCYTTLEINYTIHTFSDQPEKTRQGRTVTLK
jgi:hypothetical protein